MKIKESILREELEALILREKMLTAPEIIKKALELESVLNNA